MLYYIGGFPPPYGGVTIKNSLLYTQLHLRYPKLRQLDTQYAKRNPFALLRQLWLLVTGKNATFLVATSFSNRRRITMLLHRFNPEALERSLLIVMGGSMPSQLQADEAYLQAVSCYRHIFVETESMKQAMLALGLTQVSVYPNCRPDHRPKAIRPTGESLNCLFFSRISPEKGTDIVLDTAAATPHIRYDLYGEIDPDYEKAFFAALEQLPNAAYHGIFTSNGENLYQTLGQYDVLLLPTRWKNEGVPGILVEAMISAIPSVVSDICYNAEIITSGENGIVLEENTPEALTKTLCDLAYDRQKTDRLKQGALKHSEYYLLDNHLDTITDWL